MQQTAGSALPTFSVCAMMREEPEVVQLFINHYRAAGAECIRIFHDAPISRLAGLDLDGVELVECDAAFWAPLCGARPVSLDVALETVHKLAVRDMTTDWLLLVDADEFLVGGPVRDMLARVPTDVESLRIRNAEAVWGPGDDIALPFGSTYFRRPLPKLLAPVLSRLLYGRFSAFFRRGLIGHAQGKQFVRRDADFTGLNTHTCLRDGRPIGRWAHKVVPGGSDFFIAHFDAIGFRRWREKWRRRFSGEVEATKMAPRRAAQMPAIQAALAAGDDEALGMFRQFYGVGPWRKGVLRALGMLEMRRVFDAEALRSVGGPPPGGVSMGGE
jgi:hypothetical protein